MRPRNGEKMIFSLWHFLIEIRVVALFQGWGGQISTFSEKWSKKSIFYRKKIFFRERIKCWAQVGRFRQPVRTEVIEVKFSKKIMIFDIFLWFLTFSPIWLTFDSLLLWSELSGVKKYVYNIKGHLSQKRLKKEIFAKIWWKKLKFCWFLIPFIFLTKSDRHIL